MPEWPGQRRFRVTNNTVTEVQPQQCNLVGILWHNDDAAARFLQLFNARPADVTLGTTVPAMVIQVGADSTDEHDFFGGTWTTALSFAITTTSEGSTGGTLSHITFFVL